MKKDNLKKFFAEKITHADLTDEQVYGLINTLFPSQKAILTDAARESSLAMAAEFQKWQATQPEPSLVMTEKEIEELASTF